MSNFANRIPPLRGDNVHSTSLTFVCVHVFVAPTLKHRCRWRVLERACMLRWLALWISLAYKMVSFRQAIGACLRKIIPTRDVGKNTDRGFEQRLHHTLTPTGDLPPSLTRCQQNSETKLAKLNLSPLLATTEWREHSQNPLWRFCQGKREKAAVFVRPHMGSPLHCQPRLHNFTSQHNNFLNLSSHLNLSSLSRQTRPAIRLDLRWRTE